MELSKNIVCEFASVLEKNNYFLYDAFLEQEGEIIFLRVYIQNEIKSISLEDCVKVSKLITEMLDKNDAIEEKYILEIASPGVIKYLRTIKLMESEIGEKVTVYFKKKEKATGAKNIIGSLDAVSDTCVSVDGVEFEHEKIKKIETYYEF